MRALALADNALAADRLVRSTYLHCAYNAAEFLQHPNPRHWLLVAMERLVEPWRTQRGAERALDRLWSTGMEASW
ncbi:MAG TPA: hypothetical protein VND93_21690 [Myxococcales bacterium]|nr:hypothetical protein [Myxococcales bacterium]